MIGSTWRSVVFSICGIILSCGPGPQKNDLSQVEFVEIYSGLLLAISEAGTKTPPDSASAAFLDSLGWTIAEFDSAIAGFQANPSIWLEILAQITTRLEESGISNFDSLGQK